jgi:hypothetical protein
MAWGLLYWTGTVSKSFVPQEDRNDIVQSFLARTATKKMVLLGTLIERRKSQRNEPIEAGLKWAKLAFGNQVKDIKRTHRCA